MNIPEDPFMLMSMLNMKLRDGDYSDLQDLCQSLSINKDEIEKKLKSAGFEYNDSLKQFR